MRARACLVIVGLLSPAGAHWSPKRGAGLGPTVTGDIVLRARDLVDMKWDPDWGISRPQDSEFVRWEVHRGSSYEDLLPYDRNETPGWEGILKHGIYHQLKGLGVDESVMWGDHYFVEALDTILA